MILKLSKLYVHIKMELALYSLAAIQKKQMKPQQKN